MAVYIDDFTRANSGTIGDFAHPWTEAGVAALEIASNSLHTTDTAGADSFSRYEGDLASDDHWCEVMISTLTASGAGPGGGPIVRYSSSAETFYFGYVLRSGSDQMYIWKSVAGTLTQLANIGGLTFPTLPFRVRLTAFGSSLSFFIERDEILNLTDASIPTGRRCGVNLFRNVVGADVNMISWKAADARMDDNSQRSYNKARRLK